jgi:hypothetical protein
MWTAPRFLAPLARLPVGGRRSMSKLGGERVEASLRPYFNTPP